MVHVGWRNKLSDIVTMFWTSVQYNVELIMTVGPRGSPIYNEFWRDVTMKHFLVYGAWSTFNWHVNRLNIKFARFIPALGADISHCIPVWKASFKFLEHGSIFLQTAHEVVDITRHYLPISNFDIVESAEKHKYLPNLIVFVIRCTMNM